MEVFPVLVMLLNTKAAKWRNALVSWVCFSANLLKLLLFLLQFIDKISDLVIYNYVFMCPDNKFPLI